MKKNEKRLVGFIAYAPIFFVPFLIFVMFTYLFNTHTKNYKESIVKIEKDILKSEKKAIRMKIDSISDLVDYQNSLIVKDLKTRIKDRVDNATKIANSIYMQYKDTKTKKEIQNIITTTLRPLLWNDEESFIWILDFEGKFHLAPKYLRHLEGKSIINFQTSSGRYLIKDEIALCKKDGEGFMWSEFTKPNEMGIHKQLAFVKSFKKYDWYLGSSEYLQTATKISDKKLLKSIDTISKKGKGYLFVISKDGRLIYNPSFSNEDIGRLHKDIKDIKYRQMIEKQMNLVSKEDSKFISYNWFNPDTQKNELKYSYLKKVPSKGWIIGTGIYESEIKQKAQDRLKELQGTYKIGINNLLIMGAMILIIALVVSLWLSNYIKNNFKKYHLNIEQKTDELEALNHSLEEKVIQRTSELKESYKNLEKLATIDTLTQVNNRYSIMKILDQEINRYKRFKVEFSIIMFDLDFFKNINDTYGHHVGDEILKQVSQKIKSRLRDSDYIGRYGGEEFIIVLPGTNKQNAKNLADILRKTIEDINFKEVGKVTISLGVAQLQDDENSDDLFKRLDALLYDAKHCGRNCVCC